MSGKGTVYPQATKFARQIARAYPQLGCKPADIKRRIAAYAPPSQSGPSPKLEELKMLYRGGGPEARQRVIARLFDGQSQIEGSGSGQFID